MAKSSTCSPGTGSGISAGRYSFVVWVKGEGLISLEVSGANVAGSPVSGSPVLQDSTWQKVILENVEITGGGTITIKVKSATKAYFLLGAQQFSKYPENVSYIDHLEGSAQVVNDDEVSYDTVRFPFFNGTIYCALQAPTAIGEKRLPVFNRDAGGGNRLGLWYDGTTDKWTFTKKTAGIEVAWTPDRTRGDDTIIAIAYSPEALVAFENDPGNAVGLEVIAQRQSVSPGFAVGLDDVDDDYGLNRPLYFLRIDEGNIDGDEIARVFNLFEDPNQRMWQKAFEGRIFEVRSPSNKMEAALNENRFTLQEVDSVITSTHEEW